MNLTIAIMQAGESPTSRAAGIAPASGENGADTAFSLPLPDLAIPVATIDQALDPLPEGTGPTPAQAAEAAVPGNSLPPGVGNGLPLLPHLPVPASVSEAQRVPVPVPDQAQAAPGAIGNSQLQTPASPQALTGHGPAPTVPKGAATPADPAPPQQQVKGEPGSKSARPVPALAIEIAVKAEAAEVPHAKPAATATTIEPAPGAKAAPLTSAAEGGETALRRSDAAAARASAASQPSPQVQAGPDGDQPRTEGDGQKGKDSKTASPAKPALAQSAQQGAPSGPLAFTVPSAAASLASEPASQAFRPAAPETRPQEFDAIVQRLAEARETARPGQAELQVLHREFGHVAMQLEMVGRQLRVSLASSDAEFAPAVQAALAERGPLPLVEMPRGESSSARAEQRFEQGPQSSGPQAQASSSGNGGPAAQSGDGRQNHSAQASRPGENGPQSRTGHDNRDPADRHRTREQGLFA